MSARRLTPLALACLLAGCALGPDYSRPALPVPEAFRSAGADSGARALGDYAWFELFADPQLHALITEALDNNRDLRVAAARVEEAEAQLGVVRGGFQSCNLGYALDADCQGRGLMHEALAAVIDEAFSRSDDDSSRFCLELFRNLDLQLLVVTPSDKIHVVEPYIATVVLGGGAIRLSPLPRARTFVLGAGSETRLRRDDLAASPRAHLPARRVREPQRPRRHVVRRTRAALQGLRQVVVDRGGGLLRGG